MEAQSAVGPSSSPFDPGNAVHRAMGTTGRAEEALSPSVFTPQLLPPHCLGICLWLCWVIKPVPSGEAGLGFDSHPCLWEGPIPLHGHCHFLGGLNLPRHRLRVLVQIQPQDGLHYDTVQHPLSPQTPSSLLPPPSFFGVRLISSLCIFLLPPIFPFPSLLPIHLFIVHFP